MMRGAVYLGLISGLLSGGIAEAQAPSTLGTEEFGLSARELVQAIEKTEELISQCMREQGFQYFAADYNTVRAGMSADKSLPGLREEEFVNRYGFGVSTFYTGKPPQLSTGYSPAKVGLGEQNVAIFQKLKPVDQVAYNRALLGENLQATLAVALEVEDLSQTGGVHAEGGRKSLQAGTTEGCSLQSPGCVDQQRPAHEVCASLLSKRDEKERL